MLDLPDLAEPALADRTHYAEHLFADGLTFGGRGRVAHLPAEDHLIHLKYHIPISLLRTQCFRMGLLPALAQFHRHVISKSDRYYNDTLGSCQITEDFC